MTSADFDPGLEAGTISVLGFDAILSDMDYETGRARVLIQPFMSGTVILRVRSQGLDLGAFDLRITPWRSPSS